MAIHYHKKNDIWYFNVMVDGKQYHRSTRLRDKEGARVVAEAFVQDRLLEASAARLVGTVFDPTPPPPCITLAELQARWEAAQDADTSEGHKRNVRDHVRLHLSGLAQTPIDQIGLEAIQAALNTYRATHALASTNGLKRTINLLYSFALDAKLLKERPFKKLEKKKEPAKQRPDLGDDQYAALGASVMRARNIHVPLMVVILVGSGVRRTDVLHMRWAELHLESGTWTPVTGKDKAPLYIELDPWVISELRKIEQTGAWVFAGKDGEPHGESFLRRPLTRAAREMGLGRLSPHDLRSAYITYLANQGVPISVISRLVDHSDVRVTQGYLARTKHVQDAAMRVGQGIARTAVAGMVQAGLAATGQGEPAGAEAPAAAKPASVSPRAAVSGASGWFTASGGRWAMG